MKIFSFWLTAIQDDNDDDDSSLIKMQEELAENKISPDIFALFNLCGLQFQFNTL